MVKICHTTYPSESDITYKPHFEKYPFELSTFQKYAIESVVTGNHVLVTAHTGSGKTLPAEFAIEHFVSQGKKVIYTAPIKALSNQKFYEFTQKYPHISFGILTGDIKTNPEADVLIMTTEILMNTLYNKQNGVAASLLEFDMDFDNELACVVFDEIHYINDPDRGRVWEESIMLLPEHVQMVMLSATIATPERFAKWCETRGDNEEFKSDKQVYLASTNHRVVPLTHYSFITANSSVFKHIKDKEKQKEIKDMTNKMFEIQSAKGKFNEPHFHKMRKMLELFELNKIKITRPHVLNQVCKYMLEHEMLPALCFVLSRKQLEICANEVTIPLLEDDSKVPYTIRKECEQIIRRLPNFNEYLQLPEYENMVRLLEKGIAIHHSGVMPVFKEMVEILYGKGYIKLLFATETFSIGVNMPTRTVVFTSAKKFDGNTNRIFRSHEYSQMSGRAGRRGIDTIGNVIHLNNLFAKHDITSYKNMMSGVPQTLTSKFKVSFGFIINLLYTGNTDFTKYAKRSMVQEDIENDIENMTAEMYKITQNQNVNCQLDAPDVIVEEYIHLSKSINTMKNKKRKDAEKRIQEIKGIHKQIEKDVSKMTEFLRMEESIQKSKKEISNMERFLSANVDKVLNILEEYEFIEHTEDGELVLSDKGRIASQLHEVHCLVFADLLDDDSLYLLTSRQLICLFSCFTNLSTPEDMRSLVPRCNDPHTLDVVNRTNERMNVYYREEENACIHSGTEYEMTFDLLEHIEEWCDCENEGQCREFLQKLDDQKQIFLGEFTKAVMKIMNITREMQKVAEMQHRVDFLATLKEIPHLVMKFVATNQSLYV
jgi:superfamily II RNA helicase